MSSKTVMGLLAHCKTALKNNVQYIYGAKMEVLTYAQIKALQNLYGKDYVWDSDLNKAGKLCCDCSGLISSYTGNARGSSQYNSTALQTATIVHLKANWQKYVGWGIWLSGHIGVVSDTEGYYYAMDGSARNMSHRPLADQNWTAVIKLCDIDYTTETAETKEDEEVVDSTAIEINGTKYTISRILKDGKNYICLADLAGKGFDVGYNAAKKLPSLKNNIKTISIEVDGKDKTIDAVNIDGYNYCKLRDVAEVCGNMEVDYKNKPIIITQI